MLVKICCSPCVGYWVCLRVSNNKTSWREYTDVCRQSTGNEIPLASWMALTSNACLSYQPRLLHLSRGTRRERITLSFVRAHSMEGNPSVICPDEHTLWAGARSQGTCVPKHVPDGQTPARTLHEQKHKSNRKHKNGCWSSLFHIFMTIPLEQQRGTLITKMSSVQKNKKDPLQHDPGSLDSQGSTYFFIHLLNIWVGEKGAWWLALIRRTRQSWWQMRSRDLLHLGLLLAPLKLLEQAWLNWTKLGLRKWQRRLMPF